MDDLSVTLLVLMPYVGLTRGNVLPPVHRDQSEFVVRVLYCNK